MNNYEIRIIPKEDAEGNKYWKAFYPAIPAVVGGGNTVAEAVAEAEENLEFYLEYLSDEKRPHPEGYKENNYNGKIALRVSKTNHKQLVEIAEDEGVSLNMLINNAIDQFLGKKNYDIEFKQKIEQIKDLTEDSFKLQKINFIGNNNIVKKLWDDKNYEIPLYGGCDE